MKNIIKITLALIFSLLVIGYASLNLNFVQDKVFTFGINNLVGVNSTFLDDEDSLKVVVCGSRSPLPSPGRAEACILVEAGDDIYIFDIGNGSVANLQQYQIPFINIKGVFITHMHSDHIAELPELHLQSWVQGRDAPLSVYGPEGINLVTKGFELAYSADYSYRNEHHGDDLMPLNTSGFEAIVVKDKQLIKTETDGLEIIPFVVDHHPVNHAFGFRVNYKGRSVVISGDTINDGSVQQYAKDADLLVHSAINIDVLEKIRKVSHNEILNKIFLDIQTYHTPIKEAAEIAKNANVKHLLIYHAIPTPTNDIFEDVFYRGVDDIFPNYTPSVDGTTVVLPIGSNEIILDELN